MEVLKKFKNFLDETPLERLEVRKEVILVTVPSILMDIAGQGEDSMKRLASQTKCIVFGGAPLPVETGDLLANHGVNLAGGYGM